MDATEILGTLEKMATQGVLGRRLHIRTHWNLKNELKDFIM